MALEGLRSAWLQDMPANVSEKTAISVQAAVNMGLVKTDFSSVLSETRQALLSAAAEGTTVAESSSLSLGRIPGTLQSTGTQTDLDAPAIGNPAAAEDNIPLEGWTAGTAIATIPGLSLVEVPGSLQSTGNPDADTLVDRVMSSRERRGMTSDLAARDIAEAQTCLISLGYGVGSFGPFANGVDGVLGTVTSSGLVAFQRDRGLAETGTLTAETAGKLKELGKSALDGISGTWQTELKSSPFSASAFQGTANPFWYVHFVVGAGDNPETMANIDPVFKGRLAALARDMGQSAELGEGFRDLARQQELYDRYLDGTGALAAKPGLSKHNMGLAVDTQSSWLQSLNDGTPVERQTALLQYGLYKPLSDAAGISHESWHIQPLEAMNG